MRLLNEKLRKGAVVLLLSSLGSATAIAQSDAGNGKSKTTTKDETVIIKKDKGSTRTVIEIKDGSVYVNGEAVVTVNDKDAARVHKKVIIEDGEGPGSSGDFHAFGYNANDDADFRDAPTSRGRRAMLGVMTEPKSDKVGALVKGVNPGSPADDAGLQEGDVITRVDGKTIKDAAALVAEIGAQHEPGDKVTIIYERDGKERSTSTKLDRAEPQVSMRSFRMTPDDFGGQDMPNMMLKSFPFPSADSYAPSPKLGLSVEDRADGEGVRVLSVKPNSPAAAAGIKEGDVLTRIGDEKLGSVDELQMNLRSMRSSQTTVIEYQRDGKTATAEIKFPKEVKRKDL